MIFFCEIFSLNKSVGHPTLTHYFTRLKEVKCIFCTSAAFFPSPIAQAYKELGSMLSHEENKQYLPESAAIWLVLLSAAFLVIFLLVFLIISEGHPILCHIFSSCWLLSLWCSPVYPMPWKWFIILKNEILLVSGCHQEKSYKNSCTLFKSL